MEHGEKDPGRHDGLRCRVGVEPGWTGLQRRAAQADRVCKSYSYGPTGSNETICRNREDGGEVKFYIKAGSNMSLDACLDTIFDWQTENNEHYDGRFARVCLPGSNVETDPDGNDYWQEGWGATNCCPPVWWFRTITGVRRMGVYTIDDDYIGAPDGFDITGYSMDIGPLPNRVPRTNEDRNFARVRIRYESGLATSTTMYPTGECRTLFDC